MSGTTFITPSIAEMDRRLANAREKGLKRVSLFVPHSFDVTSEDIAFDFCAMENAFEQGKFRNTTHESL